jgi:hypothetical protein
MKYITLDRECDAVYVHLVADLATKVAKTKTLFDFEQGMLINVDFDNTGILIGVEIV